MLLTEKALNKYLHYRKIIIPNKIKQSLIKKYGNYTSDKEGHLIEFTEQDIVEQIRKVIVKWAEQK